MDLEKAFSYLKNVVEHDPEILYQVYNLAEMYLYGEGTKVDYPKAAELLEYIIEKETNRDKDELKKELSNKVLKELDYRIPASAKILDVKHNYNVKNNMLEYTITVTTSENIAQIDMLTKSQAQQIIKEQNSSKDGSEVVPSNPQKRPINDIRNEIENNNSSKEDTKEENTH